MTRLRSQGRGRTTGSLEPLVQAGCTSTLPAAATGAGTYRMRVSARGRDAGHTGEFAEEPVDFYLAQLWLAPEAPEAVFQVGSSDAACWHAEVGSRRARA